MTSLARERGGRCISTLYVNSVTPLWWQCAVGHKWRAIPASITRGSWCPACVGVKRGTIREMREIAESRGGVCVSKFYVNSATKLCWRCCLGHEWIAAPLQIKRGHWCPLCARVARLTLQEMNIIAARKSGRCLSIEYLGSAKPLRWICAVGHEWDARPSSIKSGNWCPYCARNRKLEFEQMCQIARERGGRCLSTVYRNGRTPLLWECSQGHQWTARPENIKGGTRKKGSWCLECYNTRRIFRPKQDLKAMQELARSRGGQCMSATYMGSKTKLTWHCAYEHEWEARPVSVLQGTWCPVCARNQRLELSALQKIAANRGGDCLSQTYVNERTTLTWYCAAGHRWSATPAKVKRGSWCPKCAGSGRRNKWIAPRTIEHSVFRKVGVHAKSRLTPIDVDVRTDRSLQELKESSLKSLRHVARISRKSESVHKSH
jgi:hypothetical protein